MGFVKLAGDPDESTPAPEIAGLRDLPDDETFPKISNVDINGVPSNNCTVISSIEVLLQLAPIRKLIQLNAEKGDHKTVDMRNDMEKLCRKIRIICSSDLRALREELNLDNDQRFNLEDDEELLKLLRGLLINHFAAVYSYGAHQRINPQKGFWRVVKSIPFADRQFKTRESNANAEFRLMVPSIVPTKDAKTWEKSRCPAYNTFLKEHLIGWIESVDAKLFKKGLDDDSKNPYMEMNKWEDLNHVVAWIKVSDNHYKMISNDKIEDKDPPTHRIFLEVVVMRNVN